MDKVSSNVNSNIHKKIHKIHMENKIEWVKSAGKQMIDSKPHTLQRY